MSQIHITHQTSSQPVALVGCHAPQNSFVNIEIYDPNHKVVVSARLSIEQYVRAQIGNSPVECTLRHYRENNRLEEEKAEMPLTAKDELTSRLDEIYETQNTRMVGLMATFESLIQGHIRPTKKLLRDMMTQLEVLQGHHRSNMSYAVQQAEDTLRTRARDIQNTVAMMFGQITDMDRAKELAEALLPAGSTTPALEAPSNTEVIVEEDGSMEVVPVAPSNVATMVPMDDSIPALEVPDIPIEDMTSEDLAREITYCLRNFEKDPKVNKTNPATSLPPLSHCFANPAGAKHIAITYISFQGATTMTLPVAREMLKQLREGKLVKHYQVIEQMKG